MTHAPRLQGDTPKSYLTLSALPGLLPEDARTAAAIEAWLAAIEALSLAGHQETADQLTADLVAFFGPQRTPAADNGGPGLVR